MCLGHRKSSASLPHHTYSYFIPPVFALSEVAKSIKDEKITYAKKHSKLTLNGLTLVCSNNRRLLIRSRALLLHGACGEILMRLRMPHTWRDPHHETENASHMERSSCDWGCLTHGENGIGEIIRLEDASHMKRSLDWGMPESRLSPPTICMATLYASDLTIASIQAVSTCFLPYCKQWKSYRNGFVFGLLKSYPSS